jgi:hypothetical protein
VQAGWINLPSHFENQFAVDRFWILFIPEQPDVPNNRQGILRMVGDVRRICGN